jgi:hypothetical protein
MKTRTILFGLLYFGLLVLMVAILTTNIYLLGFAEAICLPSEIALIIINFSTNKTN